MLKDVEGLFFQIGYQHFDQVKGMRVESVPHVIVLVWITRVTQGV